MSLDSVSSLFTNVWSIFLIVLFFGGSIFVHELGHFLAARKRGLKVARFSIGFGPKICSWTGQDGVEYRLSWLPLGGYVALPQLADMRESEGGDDTHAPAPVGVGAGVGPADDATDDALPEVGYASKFIVFVAGAVFNVIFAFLLACILWMVGTEVAEEDLSTRFGIVRPSMANSAGETVPGPAFAAGLRNGDRIVAVDGSPVTSFGEIAQIIALGAGRDPAGKPSVALTYERDGTRATAVTKPEFTGPEKFRDIGVEPTVKVTVAGVVASSAADKAGVLPGDLITHLDGKEVEYSGYISDTLRDGGGRPVTLTIKRNNQTVTITATPLRTIDPESKAEIYRLGLQLRGAFTYKTVHTPPWTLLGQHLTSTWRNLSSLVNPKSDIGLSKMSGPIGIVRMFHGATEVGITAVISLTILINISLALFNLLPIPVLDGGHILFATIAKLRGRALPRNFIMSAQQVFIVLLFSMILYVSFFDIRRW